MHKTTLLLSFLILSSGIVNAENQIWYDAERIYLQAESDYKQQLFENALVGSYLCREKYLSIDNYAGVGKCDALTNRIETQLPQREIADIYYRHAGNYFLASKTDSQNQKRALDMASKARNLYLRLGDAEDSSSVVKSQAIIQSIHDSPGWNPCLIEAEKKLKAATSSAYEKDFPQAKIQAQEANKLYLGCRDPQGINQSANLLEYLDAQMEQSRIEADQEYDLAIQSWAQGLNLSCTVHSNNSFASYLQAGNRDLSAYPMYLSIHCNDAKNISDPAQEALVEMDSLRSSNRCPEALEKMNQILSQYSQLENDYSEAEKDLPPKERLMTNVIDYFLRHAKPLIYSVQEECVSPPPSQVAASYYRQAQANLMDNNVSTARTLVQNAREIFLYMNKSTEVKKCDILLVQMQKPLPSNEAKQQMILAKAQYAIAQFAESEKAALKARTIFRSIGDTKGEESAQLLLDSTAQAMNRLLEAEKLINEGKRMMDSGDYTGAVAEASQANRIYSELNHSVGIGQSRSILEESLQRMKPQKAQSQRDYTPYILGACLLVAAAIFMARSHNTPG
jgi:hypothetical protein